MIMEMATMEKGLSKHRPLKACFAASASFVSLLVVK